MSKADNSLMIMENSKARSGEYEELLLRRDQLFRESGSYMTAYTQEFGDLITANFELKVECIKKKKTIIPAVCFFHLISIVTVHANLLRGHLCIMKYFLYFLLVKTINCQVEMYKKS